MWRIKNITIAIRII